MSKRNKKPAGNQNKTGAPTSQPHDLQTLLMVRNVLDLLEHKKIDEARKLGESIIAKGPDMVFAHHALGLIELQSNDYPRAEQWLRKAAEADPLNAEYVSNLGIAVLKQDRIDEAVVLFQKAIDLDTEHAAARIGLADALHEKKDPNASIAYFEDAVNRAPNAPGPYSHLGKALIDAKRYQDAVAILMKALQLQVNYAPAHTNLGNAFQEMGMLKEALECHITALIIEPDNIYAQNQMADTYVRMREFDKANDIYRKVIELAPRDPNSYARLGSSLFGNQDRYEEAMVMFRKALELDPLHALTWNNIGATMHDHGESHEAISYFKKALELKPNYMMARHNLALGQLLNGDLAEGWANHEIRLEVKERRQVYELIHALFAVIPKWDGKSSLQGKQILLMHEQGYGDSIQFLRFVFQLLERGANVALHVKDPLARLFQSFPGEIRLVTEKEKLPNADVSYVLMSLPYALGIDTVQDIPAYPSYLSASAQDSARWKQIIAERSASAPALKVGIVWAGNPEHGNDRRRSIPLAAVAPLFNIPGVQFYSLQKGAPTAQLAQLHSDFPIINLGDDFTDFADTAAAIDNLDLVISVDTSVLHLAGALGKLSWALLAYMPDWRWLHERSDSPWYPNMQLYRQPVAGDWDSVMGRVADDLKRLRDQKQLPAA